MGYATTNPFTGETVKEFASLTDEQVHEAVLVADGGFHTWRDVPVEERAARVLRAGELMLERKSEIAGLMTLEMGKLIAESEDEVDLAASILEYYGKHGPHLIADETLDVEEGEAVLVTRPLGVLLGVMP